MWLIYRRLCAPTCCRALCTSVPCSNATIDQKSILKVDNCDLKPNFVKILGTSYKRDEMSNITALIKLLTQRKLHQNPYSPIRMLSLRIRDYFHKNYRNRFRSPLHSFVDYFEPVVTVEQNFDGLLVPADHPSRKKGDTYYVNSDFVLRGHTSAHQRELIRSGLDHFLCLGDVYRRDEIDRSHYPCFHQMEGVSLFTDEDLYLTCQQSERIELFEKGERTKDKQEQHTYDCAKIVQHHLKFALEGLAKELFGQDIQYRWVDAYFPFTHPSFELEILFNDQWIETLGCGVIEQRILNESGVGYKVGWAFGLGIERLAMILYSIPDIRLFWTRNLDFLEQFQTDDYNAHIIYKPIKPFPKIINDMAMWLPKAAENQQYYDKTDFYDLVREIGGDLVEKVELIDDFYHESIGRQSHCYRITYRHPEMAINQREVTNIHQTIGNAAEERLKVDIRR